jgi:hypothetical protein
LRGGAKAGEVRALSASPPITDVGRRIQVSEARGVIKFLDLGPGTAGGGRFRAIRE